MRRPGTHRRGLRAGRRAAGPHLHRLRVQRGLRRCGAAAIRARRRDRAAERVRAQQARRRAGRAGGAAARRVVVRTAWVYTGGDRQGLRRRHAPAGRRRRPRRRGRRPDRLPDLRRRPGRRAAGGGRRSRCRGPILHAANEGASPGSSRPARCSRNVGADPQRVRPVTTDHYPAAGAAAGLLRAVAAVSPSRRACRRCGPGAVRLSRRWPQSDSRATAERPLPSTRD